jgi:MFS family permease
VLLASGAGDFSLREALGTRQFWMVFTMLFCSGYCNLAITVHLVPHITELGVSIIGAANILAASGGVSILGNFALGGAADRIGNRRIFIIGLTLTVADLLWLVPAREVWMLYLFAVIYGFVFGGLGAVESPLIAGLFGLSFHGLIFGMVHVGFAIGAAAGPLVTGYIFDLTGSYRPAFLIGAVIGFVGLMLAVMLKPTKRIGGSI